MNERIKELAGKAEKLTWESMYERVEWDRVRRSRTVEANKIWQWEDNKMEKFAELIVRECASLTLDHKSDDYYNGWLDYRDEIKKHFGVEE